MFQAKVSEKQNTVEIGWSPDLDDIKKIMEEHPEDEGMPALINMTLASALADISAVVWHFREYLESRLGKEFAKMYEKMIIAHPETLFGRIPNEEDMKKKAKEDIRNADFY